MQMKTRYLPTARARKIRPVAGMAHALNPLEYHVVKSPNAGIPAGQVVRIEPKRDKNISARQWKKQRKAARRVDRQKNV